MIALIDNNIVVNVIMARIENAPDGNWVTCPHWVGIGMDINTPQPPTPQPTKEDLMAELAALSEKIQALEAK